MIADLSSYLHVIYYVYITWLEDRLVIEREKRYWIQKNQNSPLDFSETAYVLLNKCFSQSNWERQTM
jgi:hypothetical protein